MMCGWGKVAIIFLVSKNNNTLLTCVGACQAWLFVKHCAKQHNYINAFKPYKAHER